MHVTDTPLFYNSTENQLTPLSVAPSVNDLSSLVKYVVVVPKYFIPLTTLPAV